MIVRSPQLPPAGFVVEWERGIAILRCGEDVVRVDRPEASIVAEGRIFRVVSGGASVAHLPPKEALSILLERWLERGDTALRDLVGDCALVIVTRKDVHAFKGLTSPFQIYFTRELLTNRLEVAASGRTVRDLDQRHLRRLLMVAPGVQHAVAETPFRGIERLRPWHVLTMDAMTASQRQLVSRRYRYGTDRAQTAEVAGRMIREVLESCVVDRVSFHRPRPICAEISGGLDSSFIASLAAEKALDADLRGYMFALPERVSHRFGEEAARAVAERWNIALDVVAPERLVIPDLSRAPISFAEPTDFFWYGPMFGAFTANALPRGSLVLTGYAGDALFMRSPLVLPRLLKTAAFGRFGREVDAFAKLAQRSRVSLAFQSAVALLSRPTYQRIARPFATRRFNPFRVDDVTADWRLREAIDWLRDDPEAQLQEAFSFDREGCEAEEALIGEALIRDDSISYLAHRRMVVSPWLDAAAIEEQSPFCDVRMFDLVYGQIRDDLVHTFAGPYKALLREAQRGIVPERVRLREEDVFVFDAFRRMVIDANLAHLHRLLADSELIDDLQIDRAACAKTLDALAFGVHSSSIRSLYVLLGYLEWWRGMKPRLTS